MGAGSDTRWFRLIAHTPALAHSLIYHELDFPTITARKIASIQRDDTLRSLLHTAVSHSSSPVSSVQQREHASGGIAILDGDTRLLTTSYNIHPLDLRSLRLPENKPSTVDESGEGNEEGLIQHPFLNVDRSLPTLLISECCLVYLPLDQADAVLRYFTSYLFPPLTTRPTNTLNAPLSNDMNFTPTDNIPTTTTTTANISTPPPPPSTSDSTPLGIILYEPIRPNDAFGRVMVKNLARRGIVLRTLEQYGTLSRQRQRFRDAGFTAGQGVVDIDHVFEHWIDATERERVAALEMLDEVEEWRLLARHYCVGWAWREEEDDDEDEEEGGKGDEVDEEKERRRRRRREESVFSGWKQHLPIQELDDG